MTSYRLHIAIAEAIQAHAEQYSRGKIDLVKAVSALGEVTCDFLADIRDAAERENAWQAFLNGVREAAERKAKQLHEAPKQQQ